jgi:hypothetical protein
MLQDTVGLPSVAIPSTPAAITFGGKVAASTTQRIADLRAYGDVDKVCLTNVEYVCLAAFLDREATLTEIPRRLTYLGVSITCPYASMLAEQFPAVSKPKLSRPLSAYPDAVKVAQNAS